MSSGISYFTSVWDYVDFLPPFLIVAIVSVHISVYYETKENNPPNINDFIVTVHAIASFLMWIKMLYFMRIFESTAYLVRMLQMVIWDIKIFLLILALVYFAFGEAFLRISEASSLNNPDAGFILNYADAWRYSFTISLAAGDTSNYFLCDQPTTLWILFSLCLIITNIVMLNMLIALIGETFHDVTDMRVQAFYQERASMISDNQYLIPLRRKKEMEDEHNYIITAIETAVEEDDDIKKIAS